MPVLLHSKTPVSRGNVRCSLYTARIDKGTLDAYHTIKDRLQELIEENA